MSLPTAPDAPPVRVFGIRHHGPGSARALARALDAYAPTMVLIEGPADADRLVSWVGRGLVPPVALLAWDLAEPARSAFWPLAVFSPEWQALTWATEHGAEVAFMDLPSTLVLAPDPNAEDAIPNPDPAALLPDSPDATAEPSDKEVADTDADDPDDAGRNDTREQDAPRSPRVDPIATLAKVAGYSDPEAWWEDAVELRGAGADPFDAITDAMAELRASAGETDPTTLAREAHMRQKLRAAKRAGHPRIAVVCGAWHAPALAGKLPAASADAAALRGLPKTKTDVTWVPWTHGRLAFASGYGAGVSSPGWYHHLFTTAEEPIARWLAHVARVLRAHDLPVSTAHVIEATRLAEALGALRGRPLPGLDEVTEATWSVLCDGNPVLLELVTREAVVGETLGEVPEGVGMVPLDADLRARAKQLRLRFEASAKAIALDLRKPNDLAKSQLLRQLRLLDIGWGRPDAVSSTGTFKEGWTLTWQPEFAVRIVEAGRHGNTVPTAATAALLERTDTLTAVTTALEQALLAGLDAAVDPLLVLLDERAAHESDVVTLLASVPPLARTQRYGDVRGTDTAALAALTDALLRRACAGLPPAASGLSDEAAARLRTVIDGVHAVIALLDPQTSELWQQTLLATAERRDVPGMIAGRLVRLLLDAGVLDADAAAQRLSRALSIGTEPATQATWVEGFLAGSPLLVIHDDRLVQLLDEWLTSIPGEAFTDVLPIVRRTFGAWESAARRQLANAVSGLDAASATVAEASEDWATMGPVLATVALILGGDHG